MPAGHAGAAQPKATSYGPPTSACPTPVWNQTARLFLPLKFTIGWKPTAHPVLSAEFGIPIIKDFPVCTFKTQFESGLFCFNSRPVDKTAWGANDRSLRRRDMRRSI